MCAVKTPKISSTDEKAKEPAVLRNPILDGLLGDIASIRNGRNSLRINLLNPLAIPSGGGVGGGGVGGDVGSGGGTTVVSGGGSTSSSGGGFGGGGGIGTFGGGIGINER